MAELLQRMGSAEIAEWIAELGTLRPEDEKAAFDRAERESKSGTDKRIRREDLK